MTLFQDSSLKEAEISSIKLSEFLDDKAEELSALLGERAELLSRAKSVYDWAILSDILDGKAYLSLAKVEVYNKHGRDLELLKQTVKEYLPERYAEIFHRCADKLNNYPAYSGKTKANYRCSYEGFKKYLQNELKKIPSGNDSVQSILSELEAGTFLPKLTGKNNSVIPNQVHRKELKAILDRAEAYLPFLGETDEQGLSCKDKILSIFDYRIPYYVGPLNQASPFSWVVRKDGTLYPWTFEQMIDAEKSAERFISNMTSKCTYIKRDVLPKDSLLYSEFQLYNELNNLRVNGKRVSPELRDGIIAELFMKRKKVSRNSLVGYLRSVGACKGQEDISGIDGDFKASMRSWQVFHRILERTGDRDMIEDIIRRIVLFGEDRKLLREYIKRTYGDVLTDEDIRYVCKQRFSGWGRLSGEFLTEIYHADPDTGEAYSIMDMLRRTNHNLMELLSSAFTFTEAVDRYNQQNNSMTTESLDQFLEESNASPAIRRAIRQTVRITDEIIKVMGKCPPKRIFVEMARGAEEKKRTTSRKDRLIALYKSCDKDAAELFPGLEARSEGDLRRDKLYLYYTQLGRCMYTGEPIELSRLDVDYDIDHIYPQSKVKDDSLDNRVLVYRTKNLEKKDVYPLDPAIQEKQRPFWSMLKERGLITPKKFDRLTRSTGFVDDELAGFISRQLVETRQSSKIVAEILQQRYGKRTEIVYVKAGNVSSFRQWADQENRKTGKEKTLDFVKCREVNDYHHAKDAYLNIVVGNVYHLRFTRDALNFVKSKEGRSYSLNHMFEYPVRRGKETAWIPGEEGSMAVVRRSIRKNNILFTRYTYEVGGGLYDQTIQPKGKGQAPIKSSDSRISIEKYGGYNKLTGSYYCLVEHKKKGKTVRSIEPVYLMHDQHYRRDKENYCRQILKLEDPIVLIPRIKKNALLSIDGFRLQISSRTGDRLICMNANQLVLSQEQTAYIKKLSKYAERCKAARAELPVTAYDGITAEENRVLLDALTAKLNNALYGKKFAGAAETIQAKVEQFRTLSLRDQAVVQLEVVKLFSNSNTSGANLKALGEGAVTGRLGISKNLSGGPGRMFLIDQSVTGLFEKKLDLMLASENGPKAGSSR